MNKKCLYFGCQFIGKERIDNDVIWDEYVTSKQTYAQLVERYECSTRTIQRRLNKHHMFRPVLEARKVVVVMTTTYRGHDYGGTLFKDVISGEDLPWCFVKYGTKAIYIKGMEMSCHAWFEIRDIVCDG